MSALAWDDAPPGTLDYVHDVYRRWLGDEYDLGALDVVLATAAAERLDGDPVWLLVISGSGNAKTETVGALGGAGAFVTSTITSEGALLSATSSKERAADAHGGLLRRIGDRGIVVIKDFTSILSMNRDLRTSVLGALREVYDGKWERNVGTDGGKTLTWEGRIVVIGACTTAYDSAHAVIAAMGDRFALVRMDSATGRLSAGRQALRNVGSEVQMRADLSAAVGELLGTLMPELAVVSEEAMDKLLMSADLVTLARTAVETDFRGEPIDVHAPEMPTRFAKMLAQIVRGGLAIGMGQERAVEAALRVARDSIPPARLAVLEHIRANPGLTSRKVAKGIGRPSTTTDRVIQSLHLIGLIDKDEEETYRRDGSQGTSWLWSITDMADVSGYDLISGCPGNVTTRALEHRKKGQEGPHTPTDIPGAPCACPNRAHDIHRTGCTAA